MIRTHPLLREGREPRPFPTLFWLTCPALHAAVSRLEARGDIGELEARLAVDTDLKAQHLRDHRRYARERWGALLESERRWLRQRGWGPLYLRHGIGGVRRLENLKCLHLHLAFHLARGSAVGKILALEGSLTPCRGKCPALDPPIPQPLGAGARQENAQAGTGRSVSWE